mmetsp:Transcript_60151/g.135651  ORF Transcript_60151/g.135651 Transcript_60151/m.135651 type:complete len:294 (+) Transcript_60151:62-943(+)
MPLTGKDTMNIIFMFLTSALLAYGPMTYSGGGPGNVFTYHPLLMGMGFTLMISLGFWMFNYEDLPGDWIDQRNSRRKIHALCQLTGIACILGGYGAVAYAHIGTDAQLFQVSAPPFGFSQGPPWLRLVHILLGYLVLLLICVQFTVGIFKYRAITDDDDGNDDAYSYHEQIGNVLYASGLTNVMLGVWLWEAWSLALRCVITLTLVTSLAFGPRWDGTHGFLSDHTGDEPTHGAQMQTLHHQHHQRHMHQGGKKQHGDGIDGMKLGATADHGGEHEHQETKSRSRKSLHDGKR